MVMLLSGIFYCVWIISVGCVCKSATSDGAGFVEESAKEGELDYPEGTLREKAQNNKIGDGHLFDTFIEGNEGGVGETEKQKKILKKCTKQWNGKSGEVGKDEKWGFCDEWKMWGKEGVCGGSGVEGSVVGVNSSLKLNSLRLREISGESVLRASDGSSVEVHGCVIGVERETPPFDLCGSCGLFTNISLRSSSTSTSSSTEQIFPPLFSSKAVEGDISEKCHISVCSSHFSSFCVSSAPFISSHFVSLSQLEFFNISTNPLKTRQLAEGLGQRVFLMSGCTFSSVWDVYDGGIVPSLNSPSSSLAASNTSFVRCYRSQNVAISGSEGNPSKPARQQIADNGANSFTWCVWNGSNTTGTTNSYTDRASNGGAINMYNLAAGTLSVKFCSFNDCYAYAYGGGIFCYSINSVKIENNSFNACTAQNLAGGGMHAESISSCVRISGCEFHKCTAKDCGGGLYLDYFNVSETGCIREENGGGESAGVFDCSFTSCSLTNAAGGGMYCYGVPAAFKMRSMQFISCNAASTGGGLYFDPYQPTAPSNNIYCYFFFFHDCSCNSLTPYGHDVCFSDYYNLFSSNNPFYESYTTNSDNRRVYYDYYNGNNLVSQHTEKKDWLKNKTIYVGENGNDSNELCGINETKPCKTIGYCVNKCNDIASFGISVLVGRHASEAATINVGEKKISVVGKGKAVSVIGTNSLSISSTTLFSISSGQLKVGHVGIDHNATRSPSPSVFVVSVGSGTLSLEDVVINSSTSGGSGISSSVLEVALRQLKMIDVEIKNMKILQPLFSEPLSTGSASGESVLGNVTIRNVNRTTEGDGVVMTKSVKGGETFVVWNTTMEGCECVNGDGGGIKVVLEGISSKILIGDSTSPGGGTTTFNQCKCSGYGGGVMLWLADSSFDFTISSVSFVGCSATLGGKDVLVNGSRFVSGAITASKLNVGHNGSVNDELMGYDRNEGGMGIFPLNVFLDAFSGAAHVGKGVNGYGGYDSWFCGFGYFPCKTIAKAAENRFSLSKKNIVLDSGFELEEVVSMEGSYEWEVYCGINKTNVNVRVPSGMTSSYLINVQSASSIKNIAFQIPFSLSSATSLICLTSSSLTLTDCSVAHISESTSSVTFGYSIVNAQSGSLNVERFVMEEGLTFNDHSAIEFCEGMTNVICSGCNISGVKRNGGDGGWMKGTVGGCGTLTVDGCNVNGCSCGGGKGGGMYVGLKGSGKVAASGTSVIDGNKAENNAKNNGGRGGGMFVLMESEGCGLTIGQNVEFSKVNGNVATYGKDVFVDCGSGVFLDSKVNTNTFSFFDVRTIPSDVLKLSGSENGDESGVIPLFVYLCTMGAKVLVDGSGGNGKDHNHCGFDAFRCLTVDYCANSRLSEGSKEIEVISSSSITKEITGPSFGVNISGRIVSSDGERIRVNVSDGGSDTQDWLVGCSSSLTMSRLAFVVKGQLKARRSAFIHSTSTLSVTNCSVSFESGALTDGKIGYSIIDMAGGNLIVDGFVMESGMTLKMNGKSPITMTSGAQLEILNSRVSGVEVNVAGGSGGGGCLNVGMGVNGNVKIEESNFSSRCSGGSGMKGGGMMISVGNGGTLRVKGVKLSGCAVPSEDVENGGRGMGGGMFAELANQIGTFSLENMTFSGCSAWKGKNMFISTSDLNKTVTNDSFKFDYSSMKDDKTLFVGSDDFHQEKDLFMFLIPFSSFEIFVSSEGFDVARCGSEEEPCQTMWKGMENMIEGEGNKTIQIEGSTIIRDSFNVSNYQIKKGVKMGEENVKATLNFEKAIGGQLEYFMENDIYLELTNIQLQLTSGFDNSAKTIISNINGELVITGCSFHSEAGVNNGFDCPFVNAIGGSMEVNDLSIESCNVGNNIFVIHDTGITCHFVNVQVESLNESGGCILSIKKSETGLKINEVGEEMSLNIDNSSFSGVKRSDNGASILESKSEKKICFVVNESNITEDKAETSEKGGAIFFTLGASGSMKMIDSIISQCSCSDSTGRGGGVYLTTKERGELNFTFVGMKFSANTARVGNDIFIECFSITSQINESQFQFDLREGHYSRMNAIYGIDCCEHKEDTNLIDFVTIHQSDTIIVSSAVGSNDRQCGTNALPCDSIERGLIHLTSEYVSLLYVDTESVVGREINLKEMSLSSKSRENCKVEVKSRIEKTRDSLISTRETVSLVRVNFVFDSYFISSHESLMSPEGGILEIMNCSFSSKHLIEEGNAAFANIPFHIINIEKGELQIVGCTASNLVLQKSSIYLSSSLPSVIDSSTICNSTIRTSLMDFKECGQFTIKNINTENISVEGNDKSLISCLSMKKTMQLTNCTIFGVSSKVTKGKLMKMENCTDVKMDSCIFDGNLKKRNEQYLNIEEEMCRWDGSLVDVVKSYVMMKDTTISNSPEGGITMSGGALTVNYGRFENNNPSIEGYPSLRRNIICSDSGTLNVKSLKGGDGLKDNSSLWMLNEGCSFEGIASERDSSFFIPVLESVEAKEETDRMKLTFKGMLLVPCNLLFSVVKRKGEEKEIEKYDFDSSGFLSEREVEGTVAKDLISSCGNDVEVSVHILFGNSNAPSSTDPFVLKNRSESKTSGDERIVEGGKEGKSYWIIIVVVLIVILLVVLIVSIVLAVRWRKAKKENKDLREIVNDNIKKDPKAFEMVTMEMSPEEQWSREEKKNEENAKKRVFVKTMVHSDSEEYLLAESGSTEYILGKDSDKIPEWALEKEEEEEIRKRTPSPSISSTDTETSFVQIEDVSPTTSSMSNLVDAMACSSPHEKLIVDLRDSLFMLLHGRNEKKEMAIGTLQQREQTAAQILFWVANLALHSFDEMEVPLSSLSNLSPHVVLFSEHMVICIVTHSDLLSEDDSDSSSISSSTVVTSASDDDDSDSLPSSAFEDEDDYKKECLRWKAPELQMNKKMGATKSSIAFSIGMMLWECLTLEIPFGEYEAAIAGDKIVRGERPRMGEEHSSLEEVVKECLSGEAGLRPTLGDLKREFLGHFPKEALIMTVSDAVAIQSLMYCEANGQDDEGDDNNNNNEVDEDDEDEGNTSSSCSLK
ncbi:uncharacterized protein MONOS_12307 [Monocercomonoides exilis]|uniref:uncharacterized protein n=1 Tax=Monocercomonoides exilis TaxID=2049356 RepID=UPI00355A0AFD|nr:hypothetical protein MONOS_12307 [Monocercomonoides exilis]